VDHVTTYQPNRALEGKIAENISTNVHFLLQFQLSGQGCCWRSERLMEVDHWRSARSALPDECLVTRHPPFKALKGRRGSLAFLDFMRFRSHFLHHLCKSLEDMGGPPLLAIVLRQFRERMLWEEQNQFCHRSVVLADFMKQGLTTLLKLSVRSPL
jgi:hypothetical protein